MTRCLALVDGEHYPPVVESALANLTAQGYEVVAALFLGGTEKTDKAPDLGVPIVSGDAESLLPGLIAEHRPTVVVDLSDEPVLDYRARLRLVATTLRAGAAYAGGGFRYDPPPRPRLTQRPTVAVIGTGKRTGKTAVSIELARHWRRAERKVCIVTMGRGGPPEPVVLRAGALDTTATGLRDLAERGLHAASDYVEDALFTGVDTVGTRRCGAGPAGITVDDNFHLGVSEADGLDPDVIIYEGSGAAVPPADADATVLVMPADLDPEYLSGYFGPYRLGLADAAVILESSAGWRGADRLHRAAAEIAPSLPLFRASYQPEPSVIIAGRKVLVITTAPPGAAGSIRAGFKALGAQDVQLVHSLSDRRALEADIEAAEDADAVLVEVKAAAADIVIPWATERNVAMGFLHNRVEPEEGIDAVAAVVEQRWAAAQETIS